MFCSSQYPFMRIAVHDTAAIYDIDLHIIHASVVFITYNYILIIRAIW